MTEQELRESVTKWIEFAIIDLHAAKQLAKDESIPSRIVCYHSQQAAEKLLKALIMNKRKDIPRLHDLLILAKEADVIVDELLKCDLVWLTQWAVNSRYPGVFLMDDDKYKIRGILIAEQIASIVGIDNAS